MNERIKLLAEQAGLGQERWNTTEQFNSFLARFSELIIRECLGIVNRKEYSYHEADPLWETSQLIKEHFGVK